MSLNNVVPNWGSLPLCQSRSICPRLQASPKASSQYAEQMTRNTETRTVVRGCARATPGPRLDHAMKDRIPYH
jgi:hypothetical protein